MDDVNKETRLRANRQKGTNLVAVRGYNERLTLQLIRKHGELSKTEATRATGLSAHAVSVIFRALENENPLILGEPYLARSARSPATSEGPRLFGQGPIRRPGPREMKAVQHRSGERSDMCRPRTLQLLPICRERRPPPSSVVR